MANKQQTAVETLIEQLLQIRDSIGMNTKQNRFARGRVVDCIIKAREILPMEREQIETAYIVGIIHPLEMEASKQAKQYFNDTYKNKAQ